MRAVYHGAVAKTLFDPSAEGPFAVSRSKLELFLECPRCFWLDRRAGVSRPDNARYTLNLAVDALLKREFDAYRADKAPHPAMATYGVEAVPFRHPMLATWRDTPQGIRHAHPCGIELFGIVDDVWQGTDGALHPVDYKATSSPVPPTLEGRDGYGRQLDVYGWLLDKNGFTLAREGYVVFANAEKERPSFDGKLLFALSVLPHALDLGWIDDALPAVRECLESDMPPASTNECVWCSYRRGALEGERSEP